MRSRDACCVFNAGKKIVCGPTFLRRFDGEYSEIIDQISRPELAHVLRFVLFERKY